FKGKWPVTGDKPVISILTTGLICFNKSCYDSFVKPSDCKFVKLYYEPEMQKIAFVPVNREIGEVILPIKLVKPGLFGLVNGKKFLNSCGIKYQAQVRSYPARAADIPDSSPGYKRTWKPIKGIEIRLTEYMSADS
ncbi:hypothetical protein HY772_06135, partial [Candidatus Woesearchaeota archaeon]|nr:hypothetical protein [Candidatus Woesearchaeota archaeon]